MNKARRGRVSSIGSQIANLRAELEALLEEEQEAFDAMPATFQDGARGEKANEAISALESAVQAMEEAESACDEARA